MTARQKKLWDLLMEHEYLTSGQIARMLHVSDRTVRNDIREMNLEFGQEKIISQKGKGYYAKHTEEHKKEEPWGNVETEGDIKREIVRRVLFEASVPYLELADELYMSDSALSKLILQINRTMERRVEGGSIYKKNGMLLLHLSEREKREYYTCFVICSNSAHYFDMSDYLPFFEYMDIDEWTKQMIKCCMQNEKRFYDVTLVRLIIATGVMGERIAAGFEIEEENTKSKYVENGRFQQLLTEFKRLVGRELPPSEIGYFHQLFRDDFYCIGENNQAEEILTQILADVVCEYRFDFTGETEFRKEMEAQLNGVLQRKRHAQLFINPALPRIKSQYPLEYDISIYMADRFQQITGIEISEDEIGMITVHVIRAMESKLVHMEKKVALVNPYGKQITELMVKRLEEIGECRLKIAYQYSVFECPRDIPKDITAVLSTVRLPYPMEGIPVILCKNFLDYHEKEKLLAVVRESQVMSVRTYFKTLFKPSLFFTDLEFHSRKEALFYMCEKLKEQQYVGEEFFESVMQREMIASTAFEPGFAFAHAMENNAKRTTVCVGILRNKLPWGEYAVKIIFLFALASSWNHTVLPVYNVMINHLFEANTIHKLAKINDVHKFIDQLI